MTPSNDNRPASFDQALAELMPKLRLFSYRFTTTDNDDLVQDTVLYAMTHWQSFRPDGNFLAWLIHSMWGVRCNAARKRANYARGMLEYNAPSSCEPSQEHIASIDMLTSRIRGDYLPTVLDVASGAELAEAATAIGKSRDRVKQMLEETRADLARAARRADLAASFHWTRRDAA